ncbi:MAG: YidC/Oxa1 family membrane protein insertase, partial [Clostridiales bacterium]
YMFYLVADVGIWQGFKNILSSFLEKLFDLTMLAHIPSYALAIVLFTIIIKLVIYPLTVKQSRSMQTMQRIQPLMKELESKYKGTPEKYQQEMMKLYKQYKVNPFGGCLPMLIQFPILIALFNVLREFVPVNPEFYTFLWLSDLSKPDNLYILPVLAGIATFVQQYLMITNKQDQTQKIMLYMMPIMFGFFALKFPAGLTLYWITYSVVGTVQQYFINKAGKKEAAEFEAQLEAEKAKKAGSKKRAKLEQKKQQENIKKDDGISPYNRKKSEIDEEYSEDDYDYEDITPYNRKPKKRKPVVEVVEEEEEIQEDYLLENDEEEQ